MVSYLTEELVLQGHEVTLFASGDSRTKARLIAPCSYAAGEGYGGQLLYLATLGSVARLASEFDVIHFHACHWLILPFVRAVHPHALVTFHMPVEVSPELLPFYCEFADIPVISISDAQRPPGLSLNWFRTIHYGMPPELYSLQQEERRYLAFLGLLSPHKGPEVAIRIAREAGLPLKIAGPIRNQAEQDYFDRVLSPELDGTQIQYIGELDDSGKQDFLSKALAFLFPIAWSEPFGLVMVEAMACGTPVIAFGRGSVPEVITNGVTGFVVDGLPGAVGAVRAVSNFDHRRCRQEFERRFSASRMCCDYVDAYSRLIAPGAAALADSQEPLLEAPLSS